MWLWKVIKFNCPATGLRVSGCSEQKFIFFHLIAILMFLNKHKYTVIFWIMSQKKSQ